MKQVKVLVQLPVSLKEKLDALRSQGYTLSGYIRSLLEQALNQDSAPTKKGR